MIADDDDEDEIFGGLYDSGHWAWDDTTEALLFISDTPAAAPTEVATVQTKVHTTVDFRDDIDLIEQLRYRRRYQRKPAAGQLDVVTLQDLKDLAIYTAPPNILSSTLIHLLHIPTTERFLRALILVCAYYLQIEEIMDTRAIELETRVRTPECERVEREFSEDLADLRFLVAKEYSIMLIGGCDTKRFHHMGPKKKLQSLSDKDANLFETFLRFSVQIVWLALGRRAYNQIELETHRLFKSERFNSVEHTLKTGYITAMTPEERAVFLGHCLRYDKKLNSQSPLINEVFCPRPVDYRLAGLGIVKYPKLSSRLHYLYLAVAGPEHLLAQNNVVLGIIGQPRAEYDTMLRPLPVASGTKKPGASRMSVQSSSRISRKSVGSVKRSVSTAPKKYPNIVLPKKSAMDEFFPPIFPEEIEKPTPISEVQRTRWLTRTQKLKCRKSDTGRQLRSKTELVDLATFVN